MKKNHCESGKIHSIIQFVKFDDALLIGIANADASKRNLPILHYNDEEELKNIFGEDIQSHLGEYNKDDDFFYVTSDNVVNSVNRSYVVKILEVSPYISEVPKILAKIGRHYDINSFVDEILYDNFVYSAKAFYPYLNGFDDEIIDIAKQNDILIDNWDDLAELVGITLSLRENRKID